MANPYIRQGLMPGEWDTPEAPQIMRRQKMAEQLLQQANEPLQGQMVSGHYVAPSWTQYLAKGLQQYMGNKQLGDIEKQQKDLILQRQQAIAEALKTPQPQQINEGQPVTTSTMPAYTPEQQDRFGSPLPDVQRQAVTTTTQPTRMETPDELQNRQRQMLYQAVAKYGADPSVQLALGDLNFQREATLKEKDLAENRAFRSQEAELARQAQMQQLQMRMEDARASQAERLAAQKELRQMQNQSSMDIARLSASLRPEPMMTILGPNGEPISVPRSQAKGTTPYTPAAAKQIQEQQKSKVARGEVNKIVTQLGEAYDTLKQGGGITTTDKGVLGNIGAAISNTAGGQIAGRIGGSKNQQARDTITQTRPLLLNAIKNATGMSAQQMNSNAEMQLYLRAATDPSLGYEANATALKNLDDLYGLGIYGAKSEQSDEGKIGSAAFPSQKDIAAELARRKGK